MDSKRTSSKAEHWRGDRLCLGVQRRGDRHLAGDGGVTAPPGAQHAAPWQLQPAGRELLLSHVQKPHCNQHETPGMLLTQASAARDLHP